MLYTFCVQFNNAITVRLLKPEINLKGDGREICNLVVEGQVL